MAKVTNQNIPAQEISNEIDDETYQYVGEQYRNVMSVGAPLAPDSEESIVRESSKGARPPSQGDGTPNQQPQREKFRACVEKWRTLPLNCAAAEPCYTGPTKESINTAREGYGLICSYYDLFMKCCLDKLKDADAPYNADAANSCFPDICTSCPDTAEIIYTTLAMNPDEEQSLNPSPIVDGNGCLFSYTWDLTGVGELVLTSPLGVIYKAPSSNPGCLTATVTLSCGGEQLASITIDIITVNAESSVAFKIYYKADVWKCGDIGYGIWRERQYFSGVSVCCTGEICGTAGHPPWDWSPCNPAGDCSGAWDDWKAHADGVPGTTIYEDALNLVKDIRTQAQKDAGCCADWRPHLNGTPPPCY